MASLLSIYCPKCEQHTELSRRGSPVITNSSSIYQIAGCNACAQHFLLELRDIGTLKIVEIHPKALAGKPHPETPDFIKADLKEALDCFSVAAYNATGVMARRILEKCCKDKGAPEKENLRGQIAFLQKDGIITKDIKKWADAVRLVGNDGAHSNEHPVTHKDAEAILELVKQFIQVVYITSKISEKIISESTKKENNK
ncbi:hypothetical protein COTS27_00134 [Spirochaetota bacterium]|nr:hypothetical protein COTS27_00134 [Spirochaetota bacterium]